MIDEKYLTEALERQKEQIAERILWEKVDLPFYDYVCEDVVRYTGLSREKVEEIAEKCRWKVAYINRCGEALLMESVKNCRDILESVDEKEYLQNDSDKETYIKEMAKIFTTDSFALITWRKDPTKNAVIELSKHGICDTFIMITLGITREQVEKLKPTYEELEAYQPIFEERRPSEEDAEEKYQQALRETKENDKSRGR